MACCKVVNFYSFVLSLSDSSLAFTQKGSSCSTSLHGKIIFSSPKRTFKEICWRPSGYSVTNKFSLGNKPYCIYTFATRVRHWFLDLSVSVKRGTAALCLLIFPIGEYKGKDNQDATPPQFPHKTEVMQSNEPVWSQLEHCSPVRSWDILFHPEEH